MRVQTDLEQVDAGVTPLDIKPAISADVDEEEGIGDTAQRLSGGL